MKRCTTMTLITALALCLLTLPFLLQYSASAASLQILGLASQPEAPEPAVAEPVEEPVMIFTVPAVDPDETIAEEPLATDPAPPTPAAPITARPRLSSRGNLGDDYQVLEAQISQYLATQDGKYAVYFQDLNTGRGFGINENDAMTAASTYKVPVVLYLYQEAAAGRINLNERLTYTAADQESGAGTIYYNHPLGASFTLADLADKALKLSDNVAKNMLVRRLGMGKINAYCLQLGANVVHTDKNITSARSQGIYLQAILELARRSSLGQKMIDQMTNTHPLDRIVAGVPSGIKVAHKHGNNHGVINDVGIVFLADRPYILSLLSEDIAYFEAPAILAEISEMVYEYQVAG